MKINGVEVGEIAIDAAAAGAMGVPAVFVSSDSAGVAEAKHFLPWVETVATKQALGWNAAISKHPRRSAAEIRAGTAKAAKRVKEMKPFTFKEPITLEYRFKRLEEAQSAARSKCGWVRIDPYTCRKTIATLGEEF
jgi:D-amino peptidase